MISIYSLSSVQTPHCPQFNLFSALDQFSNLTSVLFLFWGNVQNVVYIATTTEINLTYYFVTVPIPNIRSRHLKRHELDRLYCEEAIWCNIVTRNSTLTIGVVYQQEEDVKLQNAIREVCKGECVIMGDFNHGHIQWESLESAGGDDHQFLLLTQDCFLTQHVLEPTKGGNVFNFVFSK